MKISTSIKKCLILVIVQQIQNTNDNSNKLVIRKMKDGTAGVAIKEFVGLNT